MKKLSVFGGLLALALLAGCNKNDDTVPTAENLNVALTPVATSSVLWTGVAVAKDGRVFATFPRMDTDTIPYALAVVNGTQATPFPRPIGTSGTRRCRPKPLCERARAVPGQQQFPAGARLGLAPDARRGERRGETA